MKIVLAGSRRIDASLLRTRLNRFLKATPEKTEIHIRRGKWTPMGEFETLVSDLVLDMAIRDRKEISTVIHTPEPTDERPGRASVYLRDIEMVEGADLVLLFFDPGEAVEGYSGTAHMLDKALDAGVPVEAYAVREDGSVQWIGGYEGDKR